MKPVPFMLAVGAALSWSQLRAQLVISGNENKIDLASGTATVVEEPAPDSLTLLDFGASPAEVQHLLNIPNTVIGPPSNIAITPDHKLALVASSVKVDPTSETGFGPDTLVHVLDLSATPPRVSGSATCGRQPSGISITPDGRHALVANRADGTISVLRLLDGQANVTQTVVVCEPEESLSDVAIGPQGRVVLATVQKGGYLALLNLSDEGLTATGRKISVYGQPYRCLITPDGQLGLTAGQGTGNGLDADALSVVDLTARPIRTIDYVPIGPVPESIEISPDGRLVAAVVMNGSNLPVDDPTRSEEGAVVLLERKGKTFRKVQELPVGRIPEGVAFTSDGRRLIVQCHPARELWVFGVRRSRLTKPQSKIQVPGMPSSLRSAP